MNYFLLEENVATNYRMFKPGQKIRLVMGPEIINEYYCPEYFLIPFSDRKYNIETGDFGGVVFEDVIEYVKLDLINSLENSFFGFKFSKISFPIYFQVDSNENIILESGEQFEIIDDEPKEKKLNETELLDSNEDEQKFKHITFEEILLRFVEKGADPNKAMEYLMIIYSDKNNSRNSCCKLY